jgi:hypothetical protein
MCYKSHIIKHLVGFLPIFRVDLPDECLDLLLLSQSDLFLLRLRFLGEESISLSMSEQGFFGNSFRPCNLFSLEFETSILRRESAREYKCSTTHTDRLTTQYFIHTETADKMFWKELICLLPTFAA